MHNYDTDNKRWDAICRRDVGADSEFWYGVITTGVYCYPSCPSRTSLRENTRFYTTREAAVRDGLRPCKRCQSDKPPLVKRQQASVEHACQLIDQSNGVLKVEQLANDLGISRFHLQKLFKQFLGLSPKQYMNAARARRVNEHLSSNMSVTQAVVSAGYDSLSAFYSEGVNRMGMTASSYKRHGKGLNIIYAYGNTSFGRIIVASTNKGICSVLFGDSQRALFEDLQERFSQATFTKDSDGLHAVVEAVTTLIENPTQAINLPLDIQGTAFQARVWKALCDIAPGTTSSYSEVARSIGEPTASRAVAQACAANPAAVLIPCHRVVSTSGAVSGYRWGVKRKEALIKRESPDE